MTHRFLSGALEDTDLTIQSPTEPIVFSAPPAYVVTGNSMDSAGLAGSFQLTFVTDEIKTPSRMTGWLIDDFEGDDPESSALSRDGEFRQMLSTAEQEIAEGRGISGESLRRRK